MLRNCTFLGIIEAKIWIKQTKNHTPSTVIKDNSNFESLNTELKGNLVSLLKLRETEDFCCKQRVLRHKFFIYISRFSNTLSNINKKILQNYCLNVNTGKMQDISWSINSSKSEKNKSKDQLWARKVQSIGKWLFLKKYNQLEKSILEKDEYSK